MEIKTIHKGIIDEGVDVYLEFPNTRAKITFDENTPDIVEKGLKKWFKKELKI